MHGVHIQAYGNGMGFPSLDATYTTGLDTKSWYAHAQPVA